MTYNVQILKSILLWIATFIVGFVLLAIMLPSDYAMVSLGLLIVIASIVSSHFVSVYDLHGSKWKAFTTIFRYFLDAIAFTFLFMGICDIAVEGGVSQVGGAAILFILFLVLLCAYLINIKRINETLKYLKESSPKKEPKPKPQRVPKKQIYSEPKPAPVAPARPTSRTPSLSYIDRMEGHDFEQFTANLLRKLGYERVQVTPGSGDQGVDVIATKDGKKYAIQCKRYSQKLGNKPVQEAHAGKTIYGCSVAVVLTNNYFTDGGKEAARALGVELWDRDTLRRMLVYAEHMEGKVAQE